MLGRSYILIIEVNESFFSAKLIFQLFKEFRENGRDPGTVKLDQIRLRLEREAEREEEAEFEGTRSGFLSDFKAYCRKRRRHK